MKITMLVALLLSGCAMTSGYHDGPNGKPVHYIDAMSASLAYQEAKKLCPGGYKLIGEPRQVTIVDFVMNIECK